MTTNLILTVISDDKPGVVETIAHTVAENHGNWLESRLAQLGGKFAGVIRVDIDKEKVHILTEKLNSLSSSGINIAINSAHAADSTHANAKALHFTAIGPDRPGIIKELSQTFHKYEINVEELNTTLSSMPYSGAPLFEATGKVSIPAIVKLEDLEENLDNVANTLALDIVLEDVPTDNG